MQQKRLLLALVLSSAILFGWSYFYPVTSPPKQPPGATPLPSASSTQAQTANANAQPGAPPAAPVTNVTAAPKRIITVTTPLYEAKFDTLGAEPISWIIKSNKLTNVPIYSVAKPKHDEVPLQLISEEGLKRQPRLVPFQLQTGDAALDAALSSSTYRVEGIQETGDVVKLARDEKKELTFVFEDANRVQVRKKIVFDANYYETDLSLVVKRGDETIPHVKLVVGPSIGDQGVPHHTFYSVAPEGVAYVNGKLERHPPAGINSNSSSPDKLVLNGPVDWAGVGDTYFGMVAVPYKPTEGLEYRTVAYEYKPATGTPEKRFLTTALMPVPSDGSRIIIYAGPKDHDLLTEASKDISALVQRQQPLDLEALIDYGFLGWLSRPIAVPILRAITYLNKVTGSYGLAIILFTIVIYSLFFPLKWRSSKAMKKAQKLAPKMKELQEKMKGMKQNDPRMKELQMDQLRLMKEGNPLGGCLPLLIQMPFLFALYRAITISLDFRQASFLWIPDLSAAEPYFIHILPLLMTGTMVVLQLVTPAPSADPLQRKMMAVGMPLVMLYVLWTAPSGLVLYWLVGNIVGFTQQFLINRWTKSDDEEVPEPPAAKGKAGQKKKVNAPATG